MATTEAPRNLYQRMLAAMADVRYVQKTKGKDGELKFTIVTHDAVTALCREALMKNGVYAYPEMTSCESVVFKQEKTRMGQAETVEYVAMTVHIQMNFVNADNPDERFGVPMVGVGVDRIAQQDKCPGKAMSYAVKYAYLKALALETGDEAEPDFEQHRGDEPEQPEPTDAAPPSPAAAALQPVEASSVKEMLQTCALQISKELGVDEKPVRTELKRRLIEMYGTSAPKELTVLQAGEACNTTWDYYRAQTAPSREATEA